MVKWESTHVVPRTAKKKGRIEGRREGKREGRKEREERKREEMEGKGRKRKGNLDNEMRISLCQVIVEPLLNP
jgi:hypothetical protein